MDSGITALVSGGMAGLAASAGAGLVLMHMRGEPRTMQQDPRYDDVVRDVAGFLRQRTQACIDAGIERDRIILDPGFGFGKTLRHNMQLLNGLAAISGLELPVLVGLSRKSMLGAIIDKPVDQRLVGTVAAHMAALVNGAEIAGNIALIDRGSCTFACPSSIPIVQLIRTAKDDLTHRKETDA